MATIPRQYGRRGVSSATTVHTTNSDSGAPLSPSSTGSRSTPTRRYVLDVPTSRITRTSRTSPSGAIGEYEDTNLHRLVDDGTHTYTSTITTNIYGSNNTGELARSGSKEYYYRDSGADLTTTASRYLEDASIKQLIRSDPTYKYTVSEDEEIQALTARATPDVKNYPINVDSDPEVIVKPNTQRLTYTQDVAVRYLKPNTPPPPGVRISSFFFFRFKSTRIV